jgi:hypothetical protein
VQSRRRLGRRSHLARLSQASNSSSTARWMISRAPSFASSESASRGSRDPDGEQPVDLRFDLRR